MNADRWSQLADAAGRAGLRAALGCPLGARTTYRVGGAAALGIWVESSDDAEALGALVSREIASTGPVPLLVAGNGSNLLVADEGFDGVAVFLGDGLGGADADLPEPGESETVVTTGAGQLMPAFARRCVARGWCGAEWMVGVPGSVGGAVKMNAGGHGSDMVSMLVAADVVSLATGARATVAAGDLGLRFRGSALAEHHVVLRADLRLVAPESHDGRGCAEELAAIVAWRREHQPGGQNAGSVFVNPGEGDRSAGALVDAAGLRGIRVGSAAVSDKHANFIQADPGGRATDVVAVMTAVQDAISAATGLVLRSEVRLAGFPAEVVDRFASHGAYGIDDASLASAAARLESLL